ncbi:MAG: hypothetical protein GX577_00540 [Leptolinea sp.]|nr:hypothetical protein [Leptolinea sp.]
MESDVIRNMQERINELERRVDLLYDRLNMGYSRGSRSAGNDSRVIDAIQRGDKIGAIKIYRELTGLDLREAKDAVENIWGHYHS